MTKSYVSMEAKVCPVCGITHNHNCGVLVDKRMKDSMESTTVTGYELCKEHADLYDRGYIALLEVDETKLPEGNTMQMDEAYRTGNLAHVKREALSKIFNNIPIMGALMFITTEVFKALTKLEVK